MSFGSFVLLPNITGSMTGIQRKGGINVGVFTGSTTRVGTNEGEKQGTGSNDVYFNASRSSSIYGSSNIVQPKALIFNYIVKY